MKKPENKQEFLTRLNQAKNNYTRRDQLVLLCKEMYALKKSYKSGYLGADATKWRTKVPSQYWESDNRPQNVVDVITAVLAGNVPQWTINIPGDTLSTLPTRAEKFLSGVWRLNSRRQQVNLFNYLVFRTALDGGAGIRIYWDTEAPPPSDIQTVELPDTEGLSLPLALYNYDNFPIVIEIVPIDRLYPVGRGRMGKPFDEIYHVEERTPSEVEAEWQDVEDADTKWISEYSKKEQDFQKFEYVEWWAEDLEGKIWYSCMFDKQFVIEPKEVDYPAIPYVLTTFKLAERDNPELERVPFLFPIIWATQRKDYLRSRNFRLADMFGNMPPIYRGDNPVNLQGTWGDSINLGPEDSIEFPRWPGNPPDIHKMVEDAAQAQAEGTFSPAMFGQVSSRMSGYALSQLVGSDTLRVDTPKSNIEMALGLVADIIFGLLRKFSAEVYRGINMESRGNSLAAMVAGNETKLLTVEAFIKPKHIADDIRLATLGAQLASLPKPPVSHSYILSKYFGIEQPEDEIQRKLGEDALNDPLVRLVAMFEVLQEANHFAAPIIQQQIEKLTQQQLAGPQQQPGQPQPQPTAQPGPQELGGGLPQAVGGNAPQPGPTGDVIEEQGLTQEAMLRGGPREEY